MKLMRTRAVTALCLLLVAGRARAEEEGKVDFTEDIKPILEASCLKCHGEAKSEGELRLDTKEAAFRGGITDKAIVPGDAEISLLWELVTLPPDDPSSMPREGDPLTEEQTALIERWINEGAAWPEEVVLKAPVKKAATGPLSGPGVEITDAERAAVAKLQESGALALRIAGNTNLLRVDFSLRGNEITEADLASLKDIPNLVELDLGGTDVTDDNLAHLEGLTNLVRLHLEKTKITGPGLAHLKGMQKLIYLNLYSTDVSDEGLDHLGELKSLKKLYLWQTKVTDEGVSKLQQALSELQIDRGQYAEVKVETKEAGESKEEGKEKAEKEEDGKEESKKEESKEKDDKKEPEKKQEAKNDAGD